MAAPGIKAIIFDCFGVLYIDSRRSLLDTVPPAQRQELADLFTSNNYGYFGRRAYLKQAASITGLTTAELSDYFAHEHRLNEPLVAFIQTELKPHYKIGLLSNIGRGWMDGFFSKHQLHELFDEVVLSGEEGMVKPQSAIFELMATRLNVPVAECLMIDDIAENCYGAEQAGMQPVQFHDNTQLFNDLNKIISTDRNSH
jgi:HAD superfamily hydrolase (TIGR01509 family)